MDIKKLLRVANIVDAKGLHSLAEELDSVARNFGTETWKRRDEKTGLEENIVRFGRNDLAEVADVLDKQGFAKLADQLDRIIEVEALEQQSAVDAVLSVYKRKHSLGSACSFCKKVGEIRKDNLDPSQRCPFGLPIPGGCSSVGAAMQEMEPREPEFAQNKRIFEKYKTGKKCPYAEQIIEGKNAVNCNAGTSTEGREIPKMYRGSPIYPRLFEGFNTINLDRNYYQMKDFSYYSLYM
jgi:hypothetical protein